MANLSPPDKGGKSVTEALISKEINALGNTILAQKIALLWVTLLFLSF